MSAAGTCHSPQPNHQLSHTHTSVCRDHVVKGYACYAVDVVTICTADATAVIHLCQFNHEKWGRPGPYVPKKNSSSEGEHFESAKWEAPKCLINLLNDEQVLCVGHTIQSDFTRVLRTFFPQGWTCFAPRFVDVKTLWKEADNNCYRASKKKTLAAMTKKRIKLVLPKPKSIRQGKWRSMGVMSRPALQYAALDAHAARVLHDNLLDGIEEGWC